MLGSEIDWSGRYSSILQSLPFHLLPAVCVFYSSLIILRTRENYTISNFVLCCLVSPDIGDLKASSCLSCGLVMGREAKILRIKECEIFFSNYHCVGRVFRLECSCGRECEFVFRFFPRTFNFEVFCRYDGLSDLIFNENDSILVAHEVFLDRQRQKRILRKYSETSFWENVVDR